MSRSRTTLSSPQSPVHYTKSGAVVSFLRSGSFFPAEGWTQTASRAQYDPSHTEVRSVLPGTNMVNSVVIWPTQEEPAVRPHKRRACGSTHPRPPHSAACAPLCIAPHHIASHHIASRRPVCQSVLREGHNWLCLPERSSAGRSTVTLSRTSGAPDSPLMNESEGRWCKSVCWRVFVRSIESRSRSSVPGFTGATSDFPGFLTLTTVLLRK